MKLIFKGLMKVPHFGYVAGYLAYMCIKKRHLFAEDACLLARLQYYNTLSSRSRVNSSQVDICHVQKAALRFLYLSRFGTMTRTKMKARSRMRRWSKEPRFQSGCKALFPWSSPPPHLRTSTPSTITRE